MELVIILLIGIIFFLVAYIFIQKNQNDNKAFFEIEEHELNEMEKFYYNDQKEDSRTDAKLQSRHWTNIWLFFIALYCIISIIKELIIIFQFHQISDKINEILTTLLS